MTNGEWILSVSMPVKVASQSSAPRKSRSKFRHDWDSSDSGRKYPGEFDASAKCPTSEQ